MRMPVVGVVCLPLLAWQRQSAQARYVGIVLVVTTTGSTTSNVIYFSSQASCIAALHDMQAVLEPAKMPVSVNYQLQCLAVSQPPEVPKVTP